ncbi:MAG: peptide deformylase [Patescibacteria group bacterium]
MKNTINNNMILQKENKILRAKTEEIKKINSQEIKLLIKKMVDAMFAEPDGIGIAAPQIGESKKIFLVAEDVLHPERFDKENKRTRNFLVFINPIMKKKSSKKTEDIEGCLSVRGLYGSVPRPEKITVEYFDESGNKKSRGASGLFSRVIQHEMDHLEGILFIDKAKKIQKITPPHL